MAVVDHGVAFFAQHRRCFCHFSSILIRFLCLLGWCLHLHSWEIHREWTSPAILAYFGWHGFHGTAFRLPDGQLVGTYIDGGAA
jgi:hypothetical protein